MKSFRQLLRTPLFTGITIGTLALGIGAAGAVFGLYRAMAGYKLPFPQSERLVDVVSSNLPKYPTFRNSAGDFVSWRKDATDVFESIDLTNAKSATLQLQKGPVRTILGQVTHSWFTTLRLNPVLGRGFRAEEESPGAPRVVLISHKLWQSEFAGAADILGKMLVFDGEPHAIIGVMPAGYPLATSREEAWRPLTMSPEFTTHDSRYLRARARLRDGVSAEQATRRLNEIAVQLEREHPATNLGWRASAQPTNALIMAPAQPALRLLLGGVCLVLLVLCANLSTLVQVRATDRRREMAVRAALGASRGTLLRQALGECLVLGLIGGALGFFLAHTGRDFLLQLAPEGFGKLFPGGGGVDLLSPAVALAVAVGSMVLFSLAPLARATLDDPLLALRGGGAVGSRSLSRRLLVAGQLALTIILLSCSTLLFAAFLRAAQRDQGFNPEGATVYDVSLPPANYADAGAKARFAENFTERLRNLPGVTAAAGAFIAPSQGDWMTIVLPAGRTYAKNEEPQAMMQRVTSDGLAAFGYRLKSGRWFTPADGAESAPVAVVSESLARQEFPGGNALGQLITVGGVDKPGQTRSIVGIVADIQQIQPSEKTARIGHVLLPFQQAPWNQFSVVVRTERTGTALDKEVQAAALAIDPGLPIVPIGSYRGLVDEGLQLPRYALGLAATFAGATLLLSTVGVYGIAAYAASRRTREFGLRLALGATPSHLSRLVFHEAFFLSALGALVGIPATLAVGRLLQSVIYDAQSFDPLLFAGTLLLLGLCVLLAAWLPARRAARVDPTEALRAE